MKRIELQWPLSVGQYQAETRVERWSQLDDAAQISAELTVRAEKIFPKMQMLWLASENGSDTTDKQFALSVAAGSVSPAKFVHTLPSVRATVVFQVLKSSGPMLCLEGPNNLHLARELAQRLWQSDRQISWILGIQSEEKQVSGFIECWDGDEA